jgi:SAM-dependent methyltransferase
MDYASIFERRGHEYHLAMQLAPDARRVEFEMLFDRQALEPGETLLDIPSGGGYLAQYLKVPARIVAYEFSQGFANENPSVQLLRMDREWPIGLADRVISLAGLHHNDDPLQVIARLKRHVRPGGWLHVADVAAGSRVGEFLNGFVNSANPMGHKGIFLPVERSRYAADWDVRRLQVCDCPWQFGSMGEMLGFCKLMFGLRPDCDRELAAALQDVVGVTTTPGGVLLNWQLLYMDVHVPEDETGSDR